MSENNGQNGSNQNSSNQNGSANGKHGPESLGGKQRSLENLKPPWPKGVSGNPDGRPKGRKSFASAVRRALAKQHGEAGSEETRMDALAESAVLRAISGEAEFAKIVLDRTDPKPKQTPDITINNMPSDLSADYLRLVRESRLSDLVPSNGTENGSGGNN